MPLLVLDDVPCGFVGDMEPIRKMDAMTMAVLSSSDHRGRPVCGR